MIKGLLFDLNGTLIDICTSETDDQIYRTVSNFFDYFNIKISPSILKEEYFTILKRQKQESMEEFPEFDVISLFDEITKKYASGKCRYFNKILQFYYCAASHSPSTFELLRLALKNSLMIAEQSSSISPPS